MARTIFSIPFIEISCLLLLAMHQSCGRGSSSSGSEASAAQEARGSLKSSTGNLAENAGWLAVFTERDTGISHVGLVGPGSKFTIQGLRPSRPMTVTLLNPEFVFQSVLTSPDTTVGQIRQFFTLSGTNIPSLVEDGAVVRLADQSSVTWQSDVALDSDFDGVPDGMEISSVTSLRLQQNVDFDSDGLINEKDPDIDGDGIINWFDSDIDVDTVINMFDQDSNGNGVEDYLEQNSELYYPEGIEFFSVQVIQDVVDGQLRTSLFFTAKLRKDVDRVSILGPESLFDGATVAIVDTSTGQQSAGAWDLSLADDGLNGDGEAEDRVFSRKIILSDGTAPLPGQVVFLRLQTGKLIATAITEDFPYIFPEVETSVITGTSSGNDFSVSGTPFVDSRESSNTDKLNLWTWSLILKNEAGAKIYGSSQIEASNLSFTLPEGEVPVGSYTGNVIVQSSARIPGLPAWTIKSADFNVTTIQ